MQCTVLGEHKSWAYTQVWADAKVKKKEKDNRSLLYKGPRTKLFPPNHLQAPLLPTNQPVIFITVRSVVAKILYI